MNRKEFYSVDVTIGHDTFTRRFSEEFHARNCFTRMQATDHRLALYHNRADGMNMRMDYREERT